MTEQESSVKDLVARHWDGRAAGFDGESQHGIHSDAQREAWLALLGELTGDDPLDVLDVGCGTGVLSTLLAQCGHDVIGVDVAPAMLERARTKARQLDRATERDNPIGLLRGDAEGLPLADDAVELVTARHLLWTLPDPHAAIDEWRRVVEPGGRLLLIEGHWDHEEPWDEYEEIHDDLPLYDGRPAAALQEELVDAGLSDVDHEPLMDSTLWGREPRHDYYAMTARVPR